MKWAPRKDRPGHNQPNAAPSPHPALRPTAVETRPNVRWMPYCSHAEALKGREDYEAPPTSGVPRRGIVALRGSAASRPGTGRDRQRMRGEDHAFKDVLSC
jgi:hypothetical protein